MAPNSPKNRAAAEPAAATYEGRVVFRSDHSGKPLTIRPGQFLASGPAQNVLTAILQIRAEIEGIAFDPDQRDDERLELLGNVRGDWNRYRLLADDEQAEENEEKFNLAKTLRPSPRAESDTDHNIDIIRVVRGLRDRGISAQPNHVYFANSMRPDNALFAPNMFAPNMFAPNMFAPNMFAPNMFAPNMFAGGGAGAGGCCCPGALADTGTSAVPRHGARRFPTKDLAADARSQLKPKALADFERVLAREVERLAALEKTPRAKKTAVEVHVIDIARPGVGVRENATGELKQADFLKDDAIDENSDGWADPAMGHGDFVHSIVELYSGMTATLWNAADPLGDIDDACLVDAMMDVDAAVGDSPDTLKILNLSLSGYNEDDRPAALLADQVKQMIKNGWMIVASAGNNASCRLAWPAALPDVVAVGAISKCAPAWFSNYGPWVDVSAPGVDVVARFPKLPGRTEKFAEIEWPEGSGQRTPIGLADMDTGWARWSGTSFSAPLVTARLAARLHDKNITDRKEAIEDALDHVVRNTELDWLPNYGRLLSHDLA